MPHFPLYRHWTEGWLHQSSKHWPVNTFFLALSFRPSLTWQIWTALKLLKGNVRIYKMTSSTLKECLTFAPASMSALAQATWSPTQASWRGVTWSIVRTFTLWPWTQTQKCEGLVAYSSLLMCLGKVNIFDTTVRLDLNKAKKIHNFLHVEIDRETIWFLTASVFGFYVVYRPDGPILFSHSVQKKE